MPVRRAAKVDNTAKVNRAYAESIGFQVVVINGVIDCLLIWGGVRVYIVDWKSKGGSLTDDQAKLVAKGIPIRFITTTEQLDALKMEARA